MTPLEIVPSGPLRGSIAAPPSKSATNRALVLAALADGESVIVDPLLSDDTVAMTGCLRALGVLVEETKHEDRRALRVMGTGGRFNAPTASLDAAMSGTTMRFAAAAATLAEGPVTVSGRGSLLNRSIGPLLRALSDLGARLTPSEVPPVRLQGGGLDGGEVVLDAGASSQFATAVMLVAPYARRDVTVRVDNLGAPRFVEMTAAMMRDWGVEVDVLDAWTWRVAAGQRYAARTYAVEYDASAAAHLLALAVATGGRITVTNAREDVLQPDAGIVAVLEGMGARAGRDGDALTVEGPETLAAVEVDLRAMPDQLPTIAALASLSADTSRISGVGITRGHETDRIAALSAELSKIGASIREWDDGLEIRGPVDRGARLDPHEDHRLAMAFAAIGSRAGGIVVTDPSCVSKTYPDFWRDAAVLGLIARDARDS